MATNDMLNIYKSPYMESDGCKPYFECLFLALFSMLLNHKESASDHQIL